MVNSNEGLEALATIASAVPASAESGHGGNGGTDGSRDAGCSGLSAPNSIVHAPSSGSTQPNPQLHSQLQAVFQAAAANPQWQQVLAMATANATGNRNGSLTAATAPLTQTLPPGNMNNNSNSHGQQFNAFANLQRQLQQADPSAQMALQQQLNYLNLIQLAQTSQQQQAPPPPLQQQSNMNTQLQALQLALAGRNIPGLSNLLGGPSTGKLNVDIVIFSKPAHTSSKAIEFVQFFFHLPFPAACLMLRWKHL